MKNSMKWMLVVMAMLVTVGFTSTKSQAETMPITPFAQVDYGSSYAKLQWGAVAYGNGVKYRVFWGTDATSLTGYSDSYGTDHTFYSLTPGQIYYAQVVAFTDSTYQVAVAESQVIPFACGLNEVTGVMQSGATQTSVTLKWNALAGAGSYYVYRYDGWDKQVKVAETMNTSVTISGLAPSTSYRYFVLGVQRLTVAIGSSSYTTVSTKTVPVKCFPAKMTTYYSNILVAYYGWNSINNVDGYQFQLQDYKGKVLYQTDTPSASMRLDPYPVGKFTKSRVRAYVNINGRKIYGAWSDFVYNAAAKKVTGKRVSNGKKIKVKWKKIKGCTGYTLYISKNKDSGYKKVKSLSAKKTSYTISKIGKKKLKKNKKYYVRLMYKIKVGKKSEESQIRSVITGV